MTYCIFLGMIIKSLGVQRDLMNGLSELSLSEQENGLLLQYKELIREQDRRLQEASNTIDQLNSQQAQLQAQIEEMVQVNCQLRDENTLLRAQLATGAGQGEAPPQQPDEQLQLRLSQIEKEASEYADEIGRLRKDQDNLLELLTDQDLKMNKYKEKLRELGEPVDDEDSDAHSMDESDEREAHSKMSD